MDLIFNNLNTSIKAQNEKDIISNLKLIIKDADTMINIDYLDLFVELLSSETASIKITVAEAIAEMCKQKDNREMFSHKDVIRKLMSFLKSDSPELIFTSIRALGNICYENEDATKLIDQIGIKRILDIFQDNSRNDSNSLLTVKVCGLILNLLSTFDEISNSFLKEGILQIIEDLLVKFKEPSLIENEVMLTSMLNILNILTDYLDGTVYAFSENLINIILQIFKVSEIPVISVLCLQIFYSLLENNDIKCLLAKEGICDLLYDLIEKHRDKVNDADSRSILKMACDLIVLILTGDVCWDFLYKNGQGRTYQNMLAWLDSNDKDLLCTGTLAIGNFARTDLHCIQMVQNGVAKKLINLLKNCNKSTDSGDVNLQYAILSTLRNLVIPYENKSRAIEDGIIDVLYPMLMQERFLVIFKLLGTYRMVIDGQSEVARDLLSREYFIERLVYWRYHSDHVGVIGEIPRIFCWLIKNSRSSAPFSTFLSVKDSVKCIVDMILSNYGMMQNEAFIALTILAVSLRNTEKHTREECDQYFAILCETDIGKNLYLAISKYGDKWDHQTIHNCLALFEQLIQSETVAKILKKNQVHDALQKIKNNESIGKSLERLGHVLCVFEKQEISD